MSFNPPPLPPMQPTWGQFQVWWQGIVTDLKTVLDAQQEQLDTITAMLSDNVLTPDKKPMWIFFHSYLTGEQAALDTQATGYSITTEKTAYDSAITALTSYLATLTTPVLWNDLTGNTDVVGATLRSDFNDVLVKKQALINKMHDVAQALAAAAQSTANTTKRDDAITASWTVPDDCVSANDAGADVTITVAAHTRMYGDGTYLAVSGTTFTGQSYSTTYGIYYDDLTRADTTPAYAIDNTLAHAQNNFIPGRHRVGEVTTPAPAAPPTTGGSVPPGSGVLTGGSSGRYPTY